MSSTEPPPQPATTITTAQSTIHVPRITIQFCTQCKWNLRAAYYAQELLQTFSHTLGEVSLVPSTGGTFVVRLYHLPSSSPSSPPPLEPPPPSSSSPQEQQPSNKTESEIKIQQTVLWDRKTDGGFPDTKELKNRVRNLLEPKRELGHTDRALQKEKEQKEKEKEIAKDGAGEEAKEEEKDRGGDGAHAPAADAVGGGEQGGEGTGVESGSVKWDESHEDNNEDKREECLDCK